MLLLFDFALWTDSADADVQPWWCVSGAVLSEGVALSEVAENDSRQNRNEKRHKINTKNINNSTIVSDNLEKSNHTRALLFPFPPSYSFCVFFFNKPFIPKGDQKKRGGGWRCSTQYWNHQWSRRGALFQSHVLVFIDFFPTPLFLFFEVLLYHLPMFPSLNPSPPPTTRTCCRLGSGWLWCAPGLPSGSPAPVNRGTPGWVPRWLARSCTYWQSSGRCPWLRCTRWTV